CQFFLDRLAADAAARQASRNDKPARPAPAGASSDQSAPPSTVHPLAAPERSGGGFPPCQPVSSQQGEGGSEAPAGHPSAPPQSTNPSIQQPINPICAGQSNPVQPSPTKKSTGG